MTNEDYQSFLKFWKTHTYEEYKSGIDSVSEDIKYSQFGLELLMPEETFICVTDETLQKLSEVNLINNYNEFFKKVGDFSGADVFSKLKTSAEEFDLQYLLTLLSKAFMVPEDLVKVRLLQLYDLNSMNYPIGKKVDPQSTM